MLNVNIQRGLKTGLIQDPRGLVSRCAAGQRVNKDSDAPAVDLQQSINIYNRCFPRTIPAFERT